MITNLSNGDSTVTMIESEVLHSGGHSHRELIGLIELHFVLIHFEASRRRLNFPGRESEVLTVAKCRDEFLRSADES